MRPLLRPALAVLVITASAAQAQHSPALVAAIDSMANAYLASPPVPGVSVAVVRGRDTIVMRGYGYADLATKRPAGPTTVYQIGSITKQFTSAAIMRLVEKGKIHLDDDMSVYLPNFPEQGHHVTVRELLNHTSGIHDYTNKPTWQPHWAEDLSPDSIVGFVARDTFDFAPGTSWSYDNTGYVLLGMIVEKASGKRYADYLTEQFFKPLHLSQTRYCPNHPTDTTYATGYSIKDGKSVPAAYLSMTQPFAAGALCSTVRDFLVWQRALHTGHVVSATSYALMTTPDTIANGRRLNYGFGLMAGHVGSHRVIEHSGGIFGFTTDQLWFPDDSLSVIVFTNTDGKAPGLLANAIADRVLGVPARSVARGPRPAGGPQRPQLSDIAGTYAFTLPGGEVSNVRVFVEGRGRVYVQGDHLTDTYGVPVTIGAPLQYSGDSTFTAGFDPSFRLHFASADGRVTAATITQGTSTLEGRRVR